MRQCCFQNLQITNKYAGSKKEIDFAHIANSANKRITTTKIDGYSGVFFGLAKSDEGV